MLHAPKRGEVWQVDFSITQKVRPALGISMPFRDSDRALIGVIPHTTPIRGSQFEVPIPVPFLSEGAFLLQGIQAIPPKYFLRRLGVVPPSSFGSSSRPCCVGRGCKKPMRAANKITAANAVGPCFWRVEHRRPPESLSSIVRLLKVACLCVFLSSTS